MSTQYFRGPKPKQRVEAEWNFPKTTCAENEPGYCDSMFVPQRAQVNDANIPVLNRQLTDVYNIVNSLGGGKSGALVFLVDPIAVSRTPCRPTREAAAQAKRQAASIYGYGSYESWNRNTYETRIDEEVAKNSPCSDQAECLFTLGPGNAPEFHCSPTKVLKVYLDAYDGFGKPRNERPFREVYSQCMMNGVGGFNCLASFGKAPWPTSEKMIPPGLAPALPPPYVLYMVTAVAPGKRIALMDLDIGKLSQGQLIGLMAQMYAVWQEMKIRLGPSHFSHWDFHPDNIFVEFDPDLQPRAPFTVPGVGLVIFPLVTLIDFDLVTCDAFPHKLPENKAKEGSPLGITERAMQWVFKWLAPTAAAKLLGYVISERVLVQRIFSKLPVIKLFTPKLNPDMYHILVYFVVFMAYAFKPNNNQSWTDYYVEQLLVQLPGMALSLFVDVKLLGKTIDSFTLMRNIVRIVWSPLQQVADKAREALARAQAFVEVPDMWQIFVPVIQVAFKNLFCTAQNSLPTPTVVVLDDLIEAFQTGLYATVRSETTQRIILVTDELLQVYEELQSSTLLRMISQRLITWVSTSTFTTTDIRETVLANLTYEAPGGSDVPLQNIGGVREFYTKVGHFPNADNLNVSLELGFTRPADDPFFSAPLQLTDSFSITLRLDSRKPVRLVVFTKALAPVIRLDLTGIALHFKPEALPSLLPSGLQWITSSILGATQIGAPFAETPTAPQVQLTLIEYSDGDLNIQATITDKEERLVGIIGLLVNLANAVFWVAPSVRGMVERAPIPMDFRLMSYTTNKIFGNSFTVDLKLHGYGKPHPCLQALGGKLNDILNCASALPGMMSSLQALFAPRTTPFPPLVEALMDIGHALLPTSQINVNANLFTWSGRPKTMQTRVSLPILSTLPLSDFIRRMTACFAAQQPPSAQPPSQPAERRPRPVPPPNAPEDIGAKRTRPASPTLSPTRSPRRAPPSPRRAPPEAFAPPMLPPSRRAGPTVAELMREREEELLEHEEEMRARDEDMRAREEEMAEQEELSESGSVTSMEPALKRPRTGFERAESGLSSMSAGSDTDEESEQAARMMEI